MYLVEDVIVFLSRCRPDHPALVQAVAVESGPVESSVTHLDLYKVTLQRRSIITISYVQVRSSYNSAGLSVGRSLGTAQRPQNREGCCHVFEGVSLWTSSSNIKELPQ